MSKEWKPSSHEAFVGLQILDKLKNETPRRFTKEELASEFYINPRTVRHLLHWLEEEKKEPILATSDRRGYVYATDEMIAEMLHARAERIRRAEKTLAGNQGIDRKLRKLGVPVEEVKLQYGNYKV